MCQSKAEGGRRCTAHSGRSRRKAQVWKLSRSAAPEPAAADRKRPGMPGPMPEGWEPERSWLSRKLQPTLSDADRRLFWLRENGYRGWIDENGYPMSRAAAQQREAAYRNRNEAWS